MIENLIKSTLERNKNAFVTNRGVEIQYADGSRKVLIRAKGLLPEAPIVQTPVAVAVAGVATTPLDQPIAAVAAPATTPLVTEVVGTSEPVVATPVVNVPPKKKGRPKKAT